MDNGLLSRLDRAFKDRRWAAADDAEPQGAVVDPLSGGRLVRGALAAWAHSSDLKWAPRYQARDYGTIGSISGFDIAVTTRPALGGDLVVNVALTGVPRAGFIVTREAFLDGGVGLIQRIENRVSGIWVDQLVEMTRQASRVLTARGSMWLNVGDSYAHTPREGAPRKSLLLGPQRVALALVATGGCVFRRYLGGAIVRSHDPRSPCLSPGPGLGHWERQDESPCPNCGPVEAAVSHLLAERFSFRCVRIDDRDERNHLEARLIATVAACTECRPSPDWLGAYAYPESVHRSGLWNTQYVGGPTATADDLASLRRRASFTHSTETRMRSLNDTLLLIPCNGAKAGAADPGLPVARIEELLSPKAVTMLIEGRKLAFERPGVRMDRESPLRPALAWYTGQPYATPGVRDGLIAAISRGLH